MSIKSRFKKFYKVWLEPPGVRQWRERSREPDQQKYWNGQPVIAPPLEAAYFRNLGLEGLTITRRDDSRACALVTGGASFPIPELQPGDSVQIAVTADRWNVDSSVQFSIEGQATRHVALHEGRWLDVRLPGPAGAKVLTIETSKPLWVSYPRIVRKRHDRPEAKPLHVIVMVLDGLARRRFSDRHPTDSERTVTPNLDRFFADGFDAPIGFSSSEWTLPTTASFFTGQYASRHRMVHPTLPMGYQPGQKLLAECFQEAGYHTLGFSVGNRLTPAFGSHRGFDRFIYHWALEGRSAFDYDPSVWISEIIGHLDTHRSDATFTYVHFPDTHPAWNLPPLTRAFNLARRGDSTGHDLDRLEYSELGREQGEQMLLLRLHEFDRAIESLLRYIELNLPEDTLVVLTADHGTPWPDFHDKHTRECPPLNEFRTGTFIRMKGPGVMNQVCTNPVSPNLDLMPTLLSLAGIEMHGTSDGKNLFGPDAPRSYVISESIYRGIYEVAVSDAQQQWIKRFPIDEKTFKISGPAFFQGGFPSGCNDYSTPKITENPAFDRVIAEHVRSVGLVADQDSVSV